MRRLLIQIGSGLQCLFFGEMILFEAMFALGEGRIRVGVPAFYIIIAAGLCLLYWFWLFIKIPFLLSLGKRLGLGLVCLTSFLLAPLLSLINLFSRREFIAMWYHSQGALGSLSASHPLSILARTVYFAAEAAVLSSPISMLISFLFLAFVFGKFTAKELDPWGTAELAANSENQENRQSKKE